MLCIRSRADNPSLHWTAAAESLLWFEWSSALPRPVNDTTLRLSLFIQHSALRLLHFPPRPAFRAAIEERAALGGRGAEVVAAGGAEVVGFAMASAAMTHEREEGQRKCWEEQEPVGDRDYRNVIGIGWGEEVIKSYGREREPKLWAWPLGGEQIEVIISVACSDRRARVGITPNLEIEPTVARFRR